jgi:deoxyribonuclease-4
MGKEALKIGANTFQFFTKNPRSGKAKEIDLEDIKKLLDFMKLHEFPIILAHAPYTLNACAARPDVLEFAKFTLDDDIKRMDLLPGNLYNFHPGSHVGQGITIGIKKISDILNEVLTPSQNTTVLLETMAGKGTEIGSRFEELRDIIDKIELKDRIGICLDTCHVYDAGYDIVNDLEGVLDKFDDIIGLSKLMAIHMNDSINLFESHKDRHQKIGEGSLGIPTFVNIINHPKLYKLPFYLETPNELEGYAKEIEILRKKYRW